MPFLLGPLNGGVPWPKGFDALRRQEREWLSYVRGLYKLTPGLKATREAASALLLASGHTYHEVATTEALRAKALYLPENAIDPARFPEQQTAAPASSEGPLRIAFVGRLVPYKGAGTLLKAALPLLKDGRAVLDIIGDGAEMSRLKELVRQHDLGDSVSLPGWIPHAQLHERLGQAQVFGFPSVREFGGGVVLEAMALGLAPVIADYAGPAELLPDNCGISVPFESMDSLEAGFREALTRLADDPAQAREMGRHARAYCREKLTWPAKARQLADVYAWVLDPLREKPDFGLAYEPGHSVCVVLKKQIRHTYGCTDGAAELEPEVSGMETVVPVSVPTARAPSLTAMAWAALRITVLM